MIKPHKICTLSLKCYEYNQPGHLRVDCLNFKKRIERSKNKTFNDKKAKKAYITWENNDIDWSRDSMRCEIMSKVFWEKEKTNLLKVCMQNKIK